MSISTKIRSALAGKSPAFGFWLTYPSAALAKTILAGGGFSWGLIDAEHGLITDQNYYELINAIASTGASPLIRVPWGEEWMIKRALDAGAHGIVTPMCHSAEDARRIVKYSKYPPVGSRGYGPMFSTHAFSGTAPPQYDASANDGLLVVVQIESRSGVENVEEIAAVPGVDVLFIGPFDLAMQMGIERGGKEHEAAIQRTLKACKSAGKTAAIFCTSGEQARGRAEEGFGMISIITDVAAVSNSFDRELATAKGVEVGKARDGY